jgi:hypothetical protein
MFTLSGRPSDAGLTSLQRGGVTACIGYLTAKRAFLGYDTALAAGSPDRHGVIDRRDLPASARRPAGHHRCPLGRAGAEAVFTLRALWTNGDFVAYWRFHLAQEHRRVHQARYQHPSAQGSLISQFLRWSRTRLTWCARAGRDWRTTDWLGVDRLAPARTQAHRRPPGPAWPWQPNGVARGESTPCSPRCGSASSTALRPARCPPRSSRVEVRRARVCLAGLHRRQGGVGRHRWPARARKPRGRRGGNAEAPCPKMPDPAWPIVAPLAPLEQTAVPLGKSEGALSALLRSIEQDRAVGRPVRAGHRHLRLPRRDATAGHRFFRQAIATTMVTPPHTPTEVVTGRAAASTRSCSTSCSQPRGISPSGGRRPRRPSGQGAHGLSQPVIGQHRCARPLDPDGPRAAVAPRLRSGGRAIRSPALRCPLVSRSLGSGRRRSWSASPGRRSRRSTR